MGLSLQAEPGFMETILGGGRLTEQDADTLVHRAMAFAQHPRARQEVAHVGSQQS